MSGESKSVGVRVMIPPPPVNLELERLLTKNRIMNFCREGALEKIAGCFREDVRRWNELYAKRLVEIEKELESARQNWSPAGQKRAYQLTEEREKFNTDPPYIWLAELYGNAVRSYLESTQQRIGNFRSGKS